MVCNGLTQSKFANCGIVGSNIILGLGQSSSSLSLDLVEDVIDTDLTDATKECVFTAYSGEIGKIYTVNVGGLQYHGILKDHEIKLNSNGRTISANFGDGREFLANAQLIIGKYYGAIGVYETCLISNNTLNVLTELEPGVSSQFIDPAICSNAFTKKCDPDFGFMASGRDKDGMPVFNILKMFLTPRFLRLPLTDQPLRINLDDLFLKCLLPDPSDPSTSGRLSKGLFARINQNNISILEFVETVCRDIACDYYVFIRPYAFDDDGVPSYEIVVKVVDRSIDVSDITGNANILRDYIRTNYIGAGNFANSTTTDIQYGQEITNEATKKIVFGDHYRYFVEIYDRNSNNINRMSQVGSEHYQTGSFPNGWNQGFGYDGALFTPQLPGSITGVAPDSGTPIDANPYKSLSYSATQTPSVDYLPCRPDENMFGDQFEELAAMPGYMGHRIFQVLDERINKRLTPDDIFQPPEYNITATNFCDKGGFSVSYSIKGLKEALAITEGSDIAVLTHQELLMSSNFELYKQWCMNHEDSIGGHFGPLIYGDIWGKTSEKVISTILANFDSSNYDLVPSYIVDPKADARFEIVQRFVKKIYDDYYGKEFMVLLDRKEIGRTDHSNTDENPVANTDTHDICFAKSHNLAIADTFLIGGSGNHNLVPPLRESKINMTAGTRGGQFFAYRLNGDEANFEVSDKVCDGAWFSGPLDTGVLNIHATGLENFQNSDGTIAGFVNLGQYSGVYRRMGDLVASVEADTSRFDVNNMIFQNNSSTVLGAEGKFPELYVKADFDSNMYFCRLDEDNILPYGSGGDCVLVRFSIPQIPLKKRFLSFRERTVLANTAHAELFSIFDSGTYHSTEPKLTGVFNDVFKMVSSTGSEDDIQGAQNDLSMFNYADMHQFALFPKEIAIPFESQTQIYGPFSYAANFTGLVEVEDTEIAPWQFTVNLTNLNSTTQSWTDMIRDGFSRARNGVRGRLFQEKASINVVGIPSISLTDGLELAANAGSVLSNVNINYGSNGATTSLTFSTYSRQFAETERYVKEAASSLVKAKKDLNNQIRTERNKRRKFVADSRSTIRNVKEE